MKTLSHNILSKLDYISNANKVFISIDERGHKYGTSAIKASLLTSDEKKRHPQYFVHGHIYLINTVSGAKADDDTVVTFRVFSNGAVEGFTKTSEYERFAEMIEKSIRFENQA